MADGGRDGLALDDHRRPGPAHSPGGRGGAQARVSCRHGSAGSDHGSALGRWRPYLYDLGAATIRPVPPLRPELAGLGRVIARRLDPGDTVTQAPVARPRAHCNRGFLLLLCSLVKVGDGHGQSEEPRAGCAHSLSRLSRRPHVPASGGAGGRVPRRRRRRRAPNAAPAPRDLDRPVINGKLGRSREGRFAMQRRLSADDLFRRLHICPNCERPQVGQFRCAVCGFDIRAQAPGELEGEAQPLVTQDGTLLWRRA